MAHAFGKKRRLCWTRCVLTPSLRTYHCHSETLIYAFHSPGDCPNSCSCLCCYVFAPGVVPWALLRGMSSRISNRTAFLDGAAVCSPASFPQFRVPVSGSVLWSNTFRVLRC